MILFCDEKEDKERNFFKNMLAIMKRRIKRIVSSNLPDGAVRKAELYEKLNIFFVRLPYSLRELKKPSRLKMHRLKKTIQKVRSDYSIERCVFPESTPSGLNIDCCIKNPFSGHFIYTALLINILKAISGRKGKDIRDLSVAITHGGSYNQLYSYIRLLSPLSKFLTIITHEKELIQNKIDDIFEETGLAVRVTNNAASGIKDAEVVVNLSDLCDFNISKCIKSNAVVINYGSVKTDKIEFSDIIINDVDIVFSKKFENMIENDAYKFYKRTELSELILSNKLEVVSYVSGNNFDYAVIEEFSRQFENDGFGLSLVIE